MTRQLASLVLCTAPLLGAGCATKSFVEEKVRAAEAKLTQQETATESRLTDRIDVQETRLRQTADAASQNLSRLDTRVDQVGGLATDARKRAEAAQDANVRLSQRHAHRNSYRLLETRLLFFEPDQAEIRSQDMTALEDLAKTLKADPNAVLELQGFSDPRGSDRYNSELARERVEAAARYLVQRHGIELRQLRAIAMGKVMLEPGERPSPEVLAKARRVEMRLLTPWSSWEDAVEMSQAAPERAATVALPAPCECTPQPTPATTATPSAQPEATQPPEPAQPMKVSWVESPPAGTAVGATLEPEQPAGPTNVSPHARHEGDGHKNGAPNKALVEFLKNLSPEDLGGK